MQTMPVYQDEQGRWRIKLVGELSKAAFEQMVFVAGNPMRYALPGDIVPPDLNASEGRKVAWCCPTCRGDMLLRVIAIKMTQHEEGGTYERFVRAPRRLICPDPTCQNTIDHSLGSNNSWWAHAGWYHIQGNWDGPIPPAKFAWPLHPSATAEEIEAFKQTAKKMVGDRKPQRLPIKSI